MIYTYSGITDAICSAGRLAALQMPVAHEGIPLSPRAELAADVDAMVEAMGKCIANGQATIDADELSDACNGALARWYATNAGN